MGLLISLFQIVFLKLQQHLIFPGKSFTEILSFTKARSQTSMAEHWDRTICWNMKTKVEYLVKVNV